MNLPTPRQIFKLRSKRPLSVLFTLIWLLLLFFLFALWLSKLFFLCFYLASFAWLYYLYLRPYESQFLYFTPAVALQAKLGSCWFLRSLDGGYHSLDVTYVSQHVIIFSHTNSHKQSILLGAMLSTDDWRKMQVVMRWPEPT